MAADLNEDGIVDAADVAMGQKEGERAAAPAALVAGRRSLADSATRVETDRPEAGLAARAVWRGVAAASNRGETLALDARSVDRAIGRVTTSLAESLRAVRRR